MKLSKHFLIVLFVVLISALTACGGIGVKTDDEISADIQTNDEYFGSFDLAVESIEISKRQTNEADKTDYVWATIYASNDEFSYTADYSMTYVLYNDGWQLEEFYLENQSYLGSHPESVEQAEADQAIADMGYNDIEFIDRTEYDNQVVFLYSASKTEYYLKTVYDVSLVYEFVPELSWDWYYPNESIKEQIPDVVGKWRYQYYKSNGELLIDYYVNITNVDVEQETISLEYNFVGYIIDNGFMADEYVNFDSGGVIEVPFEYREQYYKDNDNTVLIYTLELPKASCFESYDDPPEISLYLGGERPVFGYGEYGVEVCHDNLERQA